MARSRNITGYILKTYPAKESDTVIHLMSSKGTRSVYYAKGARKEKSRKSYAIDLLNKVSIKYSSNSDDTFGFIDEITLLGTRRGDINTLHSLVSLQMICELFDKFCLEESDNPQLFILLDRSVELLGNQNNYRLLASLTLKLMQLDGAVPELENDIKDSQPILEDSHRLLSDEIGYTSSNVTGAQVPSRIYKTQRFILSNPLELAMKVGLTKEESLEMLRIHLDWMEHHLERPIKSRDLLFNQLPV